jgi:type VI secretion system secreted protein VgrG
VKFHFDESALSGGKASTWVRMLQPHGGGIEGFHFPLRVGTEVVCTFSGGDPDRPFIVGVAPNALTPSPVTAANNTRNVIQTGGRNRLEIEDRAGLERITLSTPHSNSYLRMGAPNADHTFHMHTDGHTLLDQGQNLDIQVGQNKTEFVTGTTTETYQGVADIEYKAATTLSYDDTKTETVTGALTENQKSTVTRIIGTSMNETIGSGGGEVLTQQINGDAHITATGTYKVTAHVDSTSVTHGNTTTTTYGSKSDTVNGSSNSVVNGNRGSTTEGDSVSHVIGLSVSAVEGISISNFAGGQLSAIEAFKIDIAYGLGLKFAGPEQATTNIGYTFTQNLGTADALTVGGKVDVTEGFKIDVVTGAKIGTTTLEAAKNELKVNSNLSKISNDDLDIIANALHVRAADLQVNT